MLADILRKRERLCRMSGLISYMPNGQTIGMTTRQITRERRHIGTPTFA